MRTKSLCSARLALSALAAASLTTGCLQPQQFFDQLDDETLSAQIKTRSRLQEDSFDAHVRNEEQVNVTRPAPMDLLFVVDNSGSMQDDQGRLGDGIRSFINTYLKGSTGNALDREFRLAAITTDVYMANRGPGCSSLTTPPQCAADYAFLRPGVADGLRPLPATLPEGYARSLNPIVSTTPPGNFLGTLADWRNQISAWFELNVKPGIAGSGSERGLESIVRFLELSEERAECRGASPAADCFFRPNVARGIVIISDEQDSSVFSIASPSGDPAADKARYAREKLDAFFKRIDGNASDPRYFATAIVNQSNDQDAVYRAFVNQLVASKATNPAGEKSMLASIANANYEAILADIGQVVSEMKVTMPVRSSFELTQEPISGAEAKVFIVSPTGEVTPVSSSDYIVSGRSLRLTLDLSGYVVGTRVKVAYSVPDGS